LAARYSVCCRARTESSVSARTCWDVDRDPTAAGLASSALTGLSFPQLLRIDEVAALPSPAVMLSARLDRYYGRLRLPARLPFTSRRVPVIERPASGDINPHAGHRAGQGLSCSRRYYPNVPCPLRRGVPHGCTSRVFTASMAFTLRIRARLSLFPSPDGTFHDAAGFALCYGPLSCSPSRAFDAGLRPGELPLKAASLLRGRLAATPTGLTPASNDEHDQSSTAHTINLRSFRTHTRGSRTRPRASRCVSWPR
jgi:hypothetical protein